MNDTRIVENRDGVIMALGTSVRPRDANEDRYSAARSMPPAIVNLNEPVSLLKYCPPILMQGAQGACAQFTVTECDFITKQAARTASGQSLNTELAHAGFLYEQTRRLHGWFPQDSGSWPADGFDILLKDKPLWSRAPYVANPAFDYDDSLFSNAKPIDDLASHRPFYVTDGDALQRIKQFLDMGWAISLCMYWSQAYYSPIGGVMPEGINWDPNAAHAMTIRGRTPEHGGLVAVVNHWSEGWNRDVVKLGFDFRPGEVAIPDSFFLPDRNSPVFELRAASPEPVEIEPEPTPPDPDPPDPGPVTERPVIRKIKQPNPHKIKVLGNNFDPNAALWIDGEVTTSGEDGGRFVLKMALEFGAHNAVVRNPDGKASAPFQFNVVKEI